MAYPTQAKETLQALANRLARLRPTSNTDIANVGFMAGALYALSRALDLRYDDARASPDPQSMAREFTATAVALASNQEPPAPWLAGFYFHAGTMRLAALNERLDRDKDVAAKVRRSVNSLKHDPDAQISGHRTVTFDIALKAAEDLFGILEAAVH
jgi:hypothetical protein